MVQTDPLPPLELTAIIGTDTPGGVTPIIEYTPNGTLLRLGPHTYFLSPQSACFLADYLVPDNHTYLPPLVS